jgi:hypothetical protein
MEASRRPGRPDGSHELKRASGASGQTRLFLARNASIISEDGRVSWGLSRADGTPVSLPASSASVHPEQAGPDVLAMKAQLIEQEAQLSALRSQLELYRSGAPEQPAAAAGALANAAAAAAPAPSVAPPPVAVAAPQAPAAAPKRLRSRKGRKNGAQTPREPKQRKINEDGLSVSRMRYTKANITRCLEIVQEEEAAARAAHKSQNTHGHIAAAIRRINKTPGLEKVVFTHLQRWTKDREEARALKVGGA